MYIYKRTQGYLYRLKYFYSNIYIYIYIYINIYIYIYFSVVRQSIFVYTRYITLDAKRGLGTPIIKLF